MGRGYVPARDSAKEERRFKHSQLREQQALPEFIPQGVPELEIPLSSAHSSDVEVPSDERDEVHIGLDDAGIVEEHFDFGQED